MADTNAVASGLAPVLRGHGFRRYGRTFNRENEAGVTHVVNVQGDKWGGRFTINVAVAIEELVVLNHEIGLFVFQRLHPGRLPEVERPRPYVSEPEGQLRARLGAICGTDEDRWWPYEPFASSVAQVCGLIEAYLVPLLSDYANRVGIAERWLASLTEHGRVGPWQPSTTMDLVALLRGIGRHAEAAAVCRDALAEANGGPSETAMRWAAERLGCQD